MRVVKLNSTARIVRTDKQTEAQKVAVQILEEISPAAVQSAQVAADAVVVKPVAIAHVEDEKEDASIAKPSEAGPKEEPKTEPAKTESAKVQEPKQEEPKTEEIDGIKVMRFKRKRKAKDA